jgi:hypothetical protein
VLAGPLGGQIGEAGDAHAMRQPAVDRCFHEVGRKECERDGHIDLPNAAPLSLRNRLCRRRRIGRQFVKPRASAGNRCYESRSRLRPYRTSAASRAITGYKNFSVSLLRSLVPWDSERAARSRCTILLIILSQFDRLARDFAPERDLQLEIAIAIESGEWESLARPLSAYLDDLSKHSGLDLIRAAHVAQQSNQGPTMDLVKAAVAKAENDPNVWLGAYTLIVEEGLEDTVPEAHDWFLRALVLSDKKGTKGPIQKFELKELVPQQVEWNKRTRDISDRVCKLTHAD